MAKTVFPAGVFSVKAWVRKLVRERNADEAFRFAEYAATKRGLNYGDTYLFVNAIEPIELPEWDQLLREGGP